MKKKTKNSIPFVFKLFIGIVVLIGMFVVAMIFGAAETTLKDVWLALTSNRKSDTILMLREIRFPREIAAIIVGAALSVSGAIMQGLTRNPLADPGLLGLSAGANAALALTLAFIPSANYIWITISCFIGAAIGTGMVFGLGALQKGGFSPLRIVLAGAAVSTFLYAVADGIGIFFKLSKNVSMWTSGGVIGTSWEQLRLMIPIIIIGIIISLLLSRQLTILSLNEEVAVGLGQKTIRVKTILFFVVILLAGTSVALVGNMAFIGLMIPHIVRALVGTDYRYIIPSSAIVGGIFMLFADTLGRTINAPYETPVAAIVAAVGLPFFLIIIRKGGKMFS
ncbi:FecCD family ABC transporter permease [Heyndrickxia oleronia]|uniref:FecCD family ABC transporter permease n=1 Tax=Heyndrickxia oleronia TaxID=38875 RepID=UPI002430F436|nr:iron ABC transporter permease [Heyndrickxia oleronia]MCI1592368.1 iron ABC transporter permease [Heyndrickxia oleronia]MCI1613584.1 iron ABC transporter permease [Heyndrickxia oleronia]MCI1761418.1 iron ABC transporter permease [Heyndrickxia oleronia]